MSTDRVINVWTAVAKDLMSRFGTAGMSIAVREGGTTKYQHIGVRDVRGDAKPDGETIYLLSSMTKPIIAAVIGKLVFTGKLKLNEPVSNFLPVESFLQHRDGDVLRIHDLLDHTVEWYRCDRIWEGPDGHINLTDFSYIDALFQQLPSNPKFKTKASFDGDRNYSNFAYAMIVRVIEKVTGELWPDYVNSWFKEFGMYRSTMNISGWNFDENIAGAHCAPINGEKLCNELRGLDEVMAFKTIQRLAPEDIVAFPVAPTKVGDALYIGGAAGAWSSTRDYARLIGRWVTLFNDPSMAGLEAEHGIVAIQSYLRSKIGSEPLCAYAAGMNTVSLSGDVKQRPAGADGENFGRMKQAMKELGLHVPDNGAAWPFFPLDKGTRKNKGSSEQWMFSHGGNMIGATSSVFIVPDTELAVVVLTNSRSFRCDLANLVGLGLAHSLHLGLKGLELEELIKQTYEIANICDSTYRVQVYKYESKLLREYEPEFATSNAFRNHVGSYRGVVGTLQIVENHNQGRLEFIAPGAAYQLPLRVKKGSGGLVMTYARHVEELHRSGLGGKNWTDCDFTKSELSFSTLAGCFFTRVTWKFEHVVEDIVKVFDFVRESL